MSPDRQRPEPPAPAAEGLAEEAEPPSRETAPVFESELELDIVEEAGDWSPFGVWDNDIRTAVSALSRHPQARDLAGKAASVVLSDDTSVRRLNGTYRAKDQPTNVLSFPFEAPAGTHDPHALRYLGDIILAAETVACEAAEMGIPPRHHLQHLVIHGLLHLSGFDHIEDAEAVEMEAIETEVLKGLGISDPYAD